MRGKGDQGGGVRVHLGGGVRVHRGGGVRVHQGGVRVHQAVHYMQNAYV